MRQDFKSPFLKNVSFAVNKQEKSEYPFDIPAFSNGFEVKFENPVTIFVGENGSGKSTLLEAIATQCGFNVNGGNQNHFFGGDGEESSRLAKELHLSWLPKMNSGFFMRAESYFNFASYIDELEKSDPGIIAAYGGKSLHQQSHGESFLSLFKHRFRKQGIYILDEPEAALSPARQLAFLALIHELVEAGIAQFIIATHSPILMSFPTATVLSLDCGSINKIDFRETEHFKLTKAFLDSPERYFKHLFP